MTRLVSALLGVLLVTMANVALADANLTLRRFGLFVGKNDGGRAEYAGPCPPQGGPAHRYVFTLHALRVEKLPVAPDASPALVGLMTNANRIGQASFTVNVAR